MPRAAPINTLFAAAAAVFLLVRAVPSSAAADDRPAVVDWVVSADGGFFDGDLQEFRREDDRWAVFAKAGIPAGTTLATVPVGLILGPGEEEDDNETIDDGEPEIRFHCGTARNLRDAFRAHQEGASSPWGPYLDHLLEQSPRYNLPSQYSLEGMKLFLEVLGGEDSPFSLLERPVHYALVDWIQECGGAKADARAAVLVVQHSHSDRMVPLKDLYTHRNGRYANTELEWQPKDGSARIVSTREIVAGEPLRTSRTHCHDCLSRFDQNDDTDNGNNTAALFRDHGVLEELPQAWVVPEGRSYVETEGPNGEEAFLTLHGMMLRFELEEDPSGGVAVTLDFPTDDRVLLHFIAALFRQRILELHRLKNIHAPATASDAGMPDHEWEAIWEFHGAYATALKRASIHLEGILGKSGGGGNDTDSSCKDPAAWGDHYTDFHVELDHLAYNEADCSSSELVDFETYHLWEAERSNYQELYWQYRPEDRDVCLHLDNMLQICTSYRPHYHEFFVHYPARYLPKIERVVFLGSGDAMLLHEILKYPTLKKVVGLELDQTVTRKSFKHFRTQPHYDDPRVEWWYGDATKTLPLLPRDYWGSFDLLLVDLSETVVSLHVTGKHDVLDVISMLLKPEGVMLENELYIDKMSRHFDHTAHIFYGSPKVCVQVHTVSSNAVDFLSTPVQDHGVHSYLLDPIQEDADRFDFIHDYVKTSAVAQGKCDPTGRAALPTTEHGRRAGILLVLEAEGTTLPLDDGLLATRLAEKLEGLGLTPLPPSSESPSAATATGRLVRVVLKEGCVTARVWPEHDYVGFDLHFWGAFADMGSVREAMIEAVGSKVNSSYRVVVGGMHGSHTWDTKDQHDIGIRFEPKRNCTIPDFGTTPVDEGTITAHALDETIDLLPDSEGLTVVVVCGKKEDEDCLSVRLLEEDPRVEKLIPFWACEGIPEFNDGSHDFEPMYECEKNILSRMQELLASDDIPIDVFLMDLSAPLSMLQIFASVWSVPDHRDFWLEQPYVVALPHRIKMAKRKRFMDLFRKLGHGAASTMAEFIVRGSNTSFAYRVFSFADDSAVHSIKEMELSLQERLPETTVNLRLIEGGQLHRKQDLELEQRSFLPEAYDYGPNQKQMAEQRPLGRQTIFQLEPKDKNDMPSPEELIEGLRQSIKNKGYDITTGLEIFEDVGDGVLVASSSKQGDVVMVWDGLHHVDINLFSFDQAIIKPEMFLNNYLSSTGHRLQRSLRDDQPRGFGRVVNFQVDIDRDNLSLMSQ